MRELKHPNVISLNNVFVDTMTITLSFNYVAMNLKTYMTRLPMDFVFPQAVIQSYLYQIASGIVHCHQRRIFHRNLCPQNILITRKGVIKVRKKNHEMNSNALIFMVEIYNPTINTFFFRSRNLKLLVRLI